MTSFSFWSESAEQTVNVETTLQELGYDASYISIIKKIFKIECTPVSGLDTTSFMVRDDTRLQQTIDGSQQLSFTHTGQEVYPFGRSSLLRLNRISGNCGVLLGSTASNCVSTFKLFDMQHRARHKHKHVVVTCDTGFTSILRDIPNTTVAGDARSLISLNGESGAYRIQHIATDTYPQHFGGAWEEDSTRTQYEKEYTDRIASLISNTIQDLEISDDAQILVLPHNVNLYTWTSIKKKLARNKLQLFTHGFGQLGHCYGSDAFLNLSMFENDPELAKQQPDYFFCVTAGVGGFFSLIVITRDANPEARSTLTH